MGGPGFPEEVGAVYVPVFTNRSSEPEAGAVFSQALAEHLAREGRAAGPMSPARIDGEVVSLIASPAATMKDGRGVGIYRLTGTVRLKLLRDGRELCRRDFNGAEDFLPAENLLGLDANRREAVHRLAERMMRQAGRELCPP
ncbi:MAG TPA: LptE family protein [Vulgatibacter sp.]|nr:LptE family protein [Vulgatibacter sp.]